MGPLDFYATCMAGGGISCGLSHAFLTPLDLLKCNIQSNPGTYKSGCNGFSSLVQNHGVGVLFKGWAPTLIGYGLQGTLKFGFYEFFKIYFSNIVESQELDDKTKTLVYLAASASSEFIADIALCPFECIKVRVQTHPRLSVGVVETISDILTTDGINGLFRGLPALWARQIPYTMVKFACFERTSEMMYRQMVGVPKESTRRAVQMGVSFAAGYVAGVCCALISHPADNLVSILNHKFCSSSPLRYAIMKMGFMGLFTRGLPLRILMVGTQTGAQWAIYDTFKVLASLPPSHRRKGPGKPSKEEAPNP